MLNFIRLYLAMNILLISACAQLPEYTRTTQTNQVHSPDTKAALFSQKMRINQPGQSRMSLLSEGPDALIARVAFMQVAEETIDVQYFIWHDDLVGKILINELLQAAKRGVKVRMLLDDINVNQSLEQILIALNDHENVEVSLFNPFAARRFRIEDYLFDSSRINRRMHNKAFIVDGQVTIVGGRNIGNEYFHADENSNFNDIDVLSIGPSVDAIQEQFNTYWYSQAVYPLSAFEPTQNSTVRFAALEQALAGFIKKHEDSAYGQDLKNSAIYRQLVGDNDTTTPVTPTFNGKVNVVFDDPAKGLGKSADEINYLKAEVGPYFEQASKRIELISPYFVPGDEGVEQLGEYVKKGIEVRVITNSLSSTDGVLAQSGYARHRKNLLKNGIKLFELKTTAKTDASKSLKQSADAQSGLHAKIYIIDRENIFIGSFNLDPRSSEINTEVGIVYEIPEMAAMVSRSIFDQDLAQNTYEVMLNENNDVIWIEYQGENKIIYTTDPQTSLGRRFIENIYSILPIESQL